MPTFIFEAMDKLGHRQRGEIQAPEMAQASTWLQSKGYIILDLRVKSQMFRLLWAKIALVLGWSNVGLRDLALFTRQLALLTESGIHIIRSLDCLGGQTWESPLLAPIARDLSDQVREGIPLSQALDSHPAVFSPMYVSLVNSAERSGSMVTVLNRMADYLENDYRFRSRLQSALAYPALIFSTSMCLLAFLMIYVFPRFMSFFNGLNVQLPKTTQQLYILTLFLSDPWVVVITLLITPPLLYQLRAFWQSDTGCYLRDLIVLNVPVLAPLHRYAATARFCRAASVLMESGLGQMQTLELLEGMVGSTVLEKAIQQMTRRMRDEGSSFSEEIFKMKYFPTYCPYLIAVAEEVGQIGKILGRIADNLEEEVDLLAVQALNLLEPIMLGIMGVAVGFVLVSVFSPIVKLVEAL